MARFARIQSSALVDYASGGASIRGEAEISPSKTIVNGSLADDQVLNAPVEIVVCP